MRSLLFSDPRGDRPRGARGSVHTGTSKKFNVSVLSSVNAAIFTFLTAVATFFFLIIPSGVDTDAGKHCEVSRKLHGHLVPGETGQRRTGRVSLQSQQPQTKSARLLPPPAGFSTQPLLSASERGGRRRRRGDRRQQ